jgi:hypothetical protein
LCSADPKNKQARKSMPNKTEDLEIDDDDEWKDYTTFLVYCFAVIK